MRMLATQRPILDTTIARHRGRIANTAGDSSTCSSPLYRPGLAGWNASDAPDTSASTPMALYARR